MNMNQTFQKNMRQVLGGVLVLCTISTYALAQPVLWQNYPIARSDINPGKEIFCPPISGTQYTIAHPETMELAVLDGKCSATSAEKACDFFEEICIQERADTLSCDVDVTNAQDCDICVVGELTSSCTFSCVPVRSRSGKSQHKFIGDYKCGRACELHKNQS